MSTAEQTRTRGPLAEIRQREQAATPGPWHLEWDSCDCGDGYGCSHGSWPRAVHTPRAHTDRPPGEQQDYDFAHTEICELGDADAEFVVAAREDIPRLLRVVEAVRDLCRDTDGNWLEPSSSLPVGEFQAALALLDEENR